MNEIKEIIKKSKPNIQNELNLIIDKSVPSKIIEKNLDMINSKNPIAILTLIKANDIFKRIVLSEVNYVKDMLSTGVFNTNYGNVLCSDLINNDEYKNFFPKDGREKIINKFQNFINKNENKKYIEIKHFLNFFIQKHLVGK